jgi:hypothetical protein
MLDVRQAAGADGQVVVMATGQVDLVGVDELRHPTPGSTP